MISNRFLGPNWHWPNGSKPFHRAQKSLISRAQPLPLTLVMELPASKALQIINRSINSYFTENTRQSGDQRLVGTGLVFCRITVVSSFYWQCKLRSSPVLCFNPTTLAHGWLLGNTGTVAQTVNANSLNQPWFNLLGHKEAVDKAVHEKRPILL